MLRFLTDNYFQFYLDLCQINSVWLIIKMFIMLVVWFYFDKKFPGTFFNISEQKMSRSKILRNFSLKKSIKYSNNINVILIIITMQPNSFPLFLINYYNLNFFYFLPLNPIIICRKVCEWLQIALKKILIESIVQIMNSFKKIWDNYAM